MTIVKHSEAPEQARVIDLDGPMGNSHHLLAIAKGLCEDEGEWTAVRAEMTKGDYNNLVEVFDRLYGHLFVILRG